MDDTMHEDLYQDCNPVGANRSDNVYEIQIENTSIASDIANEEKAVTDYYEFVEWILYARVTVAIAIFGILGNILNLIILTQRKIKSSMDRMER